MSAIWKHSEKVINVSFCVPNCGHFQTNWLNFCPQLGRHAIFACDEFSTLSVCETSSSYFLCQLQRIPLLSNIQEHLTSAIVSQENYES